MAKAKAKTPAVTNPLKLVFPQDRAGITPGMRREVARTIGRVKGDPAKMEIFRETLAVLAKYGEDVFAKEVAAKEAAIEARAKAKAAEEARQAKLAEQRALDKRAAAEALVKEAEALEEAVFGHKT